MSMPRQRTPVRVGVGTLAWLVLAACPQAPERGPEVRVEYSGCHRVDRGPVCVVDPADEVSLWVHTTGDVRVELDGAGTATPGAMPVQGGVQHVVRPGVAQRIAVVARDDLGETSWTLAVRPSDEPEVLRRIEERKKAGAFEAGRDELVGATAALAGEHWGLALGLLARFEDALGNRPVAISHLRDAVAHHRSHGRISEEVADSLHLVRLLLWEDGSQLMEARRVLDGVRDLLPNHQESAFIISFYAGIVASHTGDHRAALQHNREAWQVAERMASVARQDMAAAQVANSEQLSGLYAQAVETLAAPLLPRDHHTGPALSGCKRAGALNNYAWGLLVAREAGQDLATWRGPGVDRLGVDPRPLLREALDLLGPECPEARRLFVNRYLNLALAELHEGDIVAARSWIERARSTGPDFALTVLDLEGRLALREGDAQAALEAFTALDALAAQEGSQEFQWRAVYGRAHALERTGSEDEALATYARGEQLFFKQSLLVPVHIGRDAFLAQQSAATRRHVALLLRRGEVRRAFDVERTLRAQYLAGLHSPRRVEAMGREEWDRFLYYLDAYRGTTRRIAQLEADYEWAIGDERARNRDEVARLQERALGDLDRAYATYSHNFSDRRRDPDPGELIVGYFELDGGWRGFALDEDGAEAVAIGPLDLASDEDALSAALLDPFTAKLDRAQRVTVLPTGALRSVDIHALPHRGDALLASKVVAYSLDLAAQGTAARPTGRRALVVADPRRDLPGARREGDAVRAALAAGGFAVETPGADGVDSAELFAAIGDVDLFHYAGHATFAAQWWDVGLLLSRGSTLSVGDILAVRNVPALVVLSGCQTAQSEPSGVENLGLAQAFVAAGSQVVVAAARPVPDDLALRFSAALYDAADQLGLGPEAVRQAALGLRAEGTDDWRIFRVLLP